MRRKALVLLVVVTLLLSLFPAGTLAGATTAAKTSSFRIVEPPHKYDGPMPAPDTELAKAVFSKYPWKTGQAESFSAIGSGTIKVMVELNQAPAALFRVESGVGLEAVRQYEAKLLEGHQAFEKAVKDMKLGASLRRQFTQVFNGYSIELPADKAADLRKVPGVKAVYPVQEYRALDDVSNPWIGADQAWAAGYTGKDLKVAVIDTGIDYNHPDLKDNYLGGFDFVDWDENPMETINPDPELATTHGTHVAGIIAGTGKAKIKGVAPEAKILAYRVLGPGGRGTTDAVVMGIERAVSDGANVLNLSLGNTLNVPDWPTSIALDNAARAGAIPVVAAGNSGPSLWTVGSPGTSRMAITVGASTVPGESITVNEYTPNADPNQPPTVTPLVKGTRMGGSPAFDTLTGSYEMEYVGLGRTTDLSGKNITGKIALIKRGEITFKDKSNNAKEAGAVGAIIFNHLDGDLAGTLGTGDFIPTLGISKAAGEALLAKIAAGTGGTPIKFSFTVNPHDVTLADKIASFSSRGPVSSGGTGFAPPGYELGYQLKPDVLGPGVNILSSVPGAGYAAYSGTSMATPHVAGAALLLKQAHPTWTVQDIKAALMNTAKDLTQPAVAQGAGRIDIMAAAGAGVLLEPDSNVPTGSLNFVFKELPASGATVTQTQMLRVKNTGSGTQTVSLSAYCAPGMTLSFDNPSPSLDAGAGANVAVTASLDSSVAKGFYEGLVTATLSDGTNLRLPVGIFVMPDMIQNFALTPSYVSPNFDNVNDYQAIFWQNTQVLSRFQLEFFAWNGSQWVDQGALLDTATMPSFGIILQPSKWALSWSPEGLPDGLYALQAIGTALDAQTTFAAAPQTFYIDITPPEIVSDLPGEGAVLNDANLSTMVTVNDRLLNKGVILSLAINGTTAGSTSAAEAGPFNFTGTLIAGPNILALKAADRAGNVSRIQTSVKYDSAAVKLNVYEPRLAESVSEGTAGVLRAHTAPGNKAFVQLNDGQELEIPVDLNTGAFQAPLNLNQGARNRIIVRAVDGTDSSKFSVVNRDIYLVDPGLTVMVPDGLDKDGNPLALNGLAVLSKDPWAAPVPNVDYRALPSGPVQFVGVKTGIGESYLLYQEAGLLPGTVNHVVFDGQAGNTNTLKINASWGGTGSTEIVVNGGWSVSQNGRSWSGETFFEQGRTDQNGGHLLHMSPGNERWQANFEISGQLGGLPVPKIFSFWGQSAEINLNESTLGALLDLQGIDGAQRAARVDASFVNPLLQGLWGHVKGKARFPTGVSRFDWTNLNVDVTNPDGSWYTAGIGLWSNRLVDLKPGDNATLSFGGPISGSIRILDPASLSPLNMSEELKASLQSFLKAQGGATKLPGPDPSGNLLDLSRVAQQTNTLALPGETVTIVPVFSTQTGDFVQWAADRQNEIRPKISISDKDGNVLVPPTEFDLWRGFNWTLPQADSGPYLVTASWDLGFYQSDPVAVRTEIRSGTAGVEGTVVSLPGPRGRFLNHPGPDPNQPPQSVAVIGTGLEFDLPIHIDNAPDLFGAQVQVNFDPALFEVVDADNDPVNGIQVRGGDLFQATPGLSELLTLENAADNTAGTARYSLSLKAASGNANPVPGVTGSGDLAFIRFRAKAPGWGAVQVSSAKLANSQASEIMAQVKDYRVQVRPGAVIKGRVQVEGRENPTDSTQPKPWDNSLVRIWLSGSDFVAKTNADGDFHLAGVPAEFAYDVYAEADPARLPAYFADRKAGVMVLGDTPVDLTLVGGDAKPNGFIDIFDVVTVAAAFDSTPDGRNQARWNKAADINADNQVDIMDLVLTTKNFSRAGMHSPR